ncbi:MAG: GTPase HflX, partial [Actinomycetota bacterium]
VMNKIDLVSLERRREIADRHRDAVLVSAATGEGMDELVAHIEEELARLKIEVTLEVPFARGDLVARVHDKGEVLKEEYGESGTRLVARVPRTMMSELTGYLSASA